MKPLPTRGLGAVALRLDHGLYMTGTHLIPYVRNLELPIGLALNSRDWDLPENRDVWPSTVDAWVAELRVEVLNHGAHHGDAGTPEELEDAIVGGLEELREQIPSATITGFAVPGTGGTRYMGFNAGPDEVSFTDTEAGRLILAHHAYSTGSIPGTEVRPLDGVLRHGLSHLTIDRMSAAQVTRRIDEAARTRTGLQLMLHPSRLGLRGYMTPRAAKAVLEHIARRRDEGVLYDLAPKDLVVADVEAHCDW